jgi:transcriptional repressor NF-X1
MDSNSPVLASQALRGQASGAGNQAALHTTVGRSSRQQRGRAAGSRARRADGGGTISNRRQGRQQEQEENSQGQAESGTGANPTPRGGSRLGRGRAGRVTPTRIPPARPFGGQLTGSDPSGALALPGVTLQADAQEFYPGQPHTQRRGPSGGGSAGKQAQTRGEPLTSRTPRARRDSKSSAPDIATRTHEDIANGIYECAICTSELGRNSKIWSCKTCWTVFHLSCIKKWSNNAGSAQQYAQQSQDEEISPTRKWRCPGCNLPKDSLPTNYFCWCEKEIDPRPSFGTPPHSCGQTCGKPRIFPRKCPHPCELICHAGPCLPCTRLGPAQSCFCKKESATRRCADTNYESGWSCKRVCGELMPCGKHTCRRECHDGPCGACEALVDGRCYCGKSRKSIICSQAKQRGRSQLVEIGDGGVKLTTDWLGIFQCSEICRREFDCGKHFCEKECHPQDSNQAHCPRSPNVITACPCGKTPLAEMSDTPRRSCLEPIPNCNKECHKPLACGHPCRQVCHSGDCAPCMQVVSISCRCGRTSSSTICHQGTLEPPQCMRVCKATLNCGRHECGERCCPYEQKWRTTRKKTRPLDSVPLAIDDGFEAEHICTRVCGRMLKCGNHPCPELCHKGPCGSCRDAIFDEISCNCGRTVLQPPLPCGTKQPPCRYNCERPKGCGHPQVVHNCHGDDEDCPKCPFLTEKICMCGKKNLKNQQCWLSDVRCGEVCGKKLRCGSHYCGKPCHRPGHCEDTGKACQQVCGKSKKACGHPCEEQCHAPYPCLETKPCTHKAIITCECQRLKQELKCNASKTGGGNTNKSLKCDDECARLERNRKLALALNIDQETHKDDHIPYSSDTLEIFQESPNWAQAQERVFRIFADDKDEKRLRFKPMPQRQRAFIHALASDFGLDSESMDPEPHRHVAVFKTPRFVSAPMKTLAECVRMRPEPLNPKGDGKRISSSTGTDNVPFNGILLTSPRFGLTVAELQKVFTPIFDTHAPGTAFAITFLPSEEIVIKSSNPLSLTALTALRLALASTITLLSIAKSIQLCTVDSSLNIIRHEANASEGEGWSRVAAKAAAPKSWRLAPERTVGARSAFMVLGSTVPSGTATVGKGKKKRAEEKIVVEDWEEEEEKEEEKERGGVTIADGNKGDGNEVGLGDKGDSETSSYKKV